jgi:hypothetical protein
MNGLFPGFWDLFTVNLALQIEHAMDQHSSICIARFIKNTTKNAQIHAHDPHRS